MATKIISKYGQGAPLDSDLETGEIGIDILNHNIYTKDGGGKIIKLSDGEAITAIDWNEITNKPTEFPPSDHTHTQDEIEGLGDTLTEINQNITEINTEIGAIATTLAFGGSFSANTGKIVTGAQDGVVSGEDIPAASSLENTFLICAEGGSTPSVMEEGDWLVSNGSEWVPITYSSGSAGSVAWDNVQGKPDFDSLYAPISHKHVIDDVTGLQDALDAKPDADHKHVIDDVTGLQAELDGKASIEQITGGTY